MSNPMKDPNAVLDYSWDWTAWLDTGETITSHTLIPTGVTVESSAVVGSSVVAWISGGTAKSTASVTCRITTSDGRTDDRTMTLWIQER